jgi:hypothetical protein
MPPPRGQSADTDVSAVVFTMTATAGVFITFMVWLVAGFKNAAYVAAVGLSARM